MPAALSNILDPIREHSRTGTDGNWVLDRKGQWSLPIRIRLSVPPTEFIPEETGWHIVVAERFGTLGVWLYPDAKTGISATFPHQDYNKPPSGEHLWREGKPCLEQPSVPFQRDNWTTEPRDLEQRILWKTDRLLEWVDAAASDRLFNAGDPVELPAPSNPPDLSSIGFSEDLDSFAVWKNLTIPWGFALLAAVPGSNATRYVTEFLGPNFRMINKVIWGSALSAARAIRTAGTAVWITLPAIPMLAPWQSASTWKELTAILFSMDVNLEEILVEAGLQSRRFSRQKNVDTLLLGFPLSERAGSEPLRMHWLAINLNLCDRSSSPMGFRPIERNRRLFDSQITRSSAPLTWIRTANWASDQLRTRGEAESDIQRKRILILGGGALGSAVAENLVRMGVRHLGVLDNDFLNVGNLSRHTLTMSSVGRLKAQSMAARLNDCAPDINVTPYPHTFPPTDTSVAAKLRSYDVVVDCTGSDDVLDSLSSFEWCSEKLFVSLAMSWRAEGLIAFSTSAALFPSIQAKQAFRSSIIPRMDDSARMEGIGCWHAVFPAAADDVQLWGAIGTKYIRHAVLNPSHSQHYYRQRNDGSVERIDL